mmetsp:Transcript_48516/g.117356  ORF Transcript_48516/g.117356 Transcript_48516/m.117356 type:complete len:318 (-) Transcript_48516:96-1049(-)
MGLVIFATYFWSRVRRCSMTHQDAATALALYFVYPAILYLLIDKFHGLCGPQAYLEKAEAIAVNESFYMPFTALMRTHKILSIILYQAQQQTSSSKDKDDDDYDDDKKRQTPSRTATATTRKSPSSSNSSGGGGNRKRDYSFEDDTRRDDYRSGGGSRSDDETGGGNGRNGGSGSGSGSGDENYSESDHDSESDGSYDDDDDDEDDDYDEDDEDDGCTRQKCRVWFHLSQELTAVCCVAFLLLVCLPVLAFWFMFLGIIASSVSLLLLLKRVWREAHVSTFAMMPGTGTGGMSSSSADKQNTPEEEEEFQEFLKNFT